VSPAINLLEDFKLEINRLSSKGKPFFFLLDFELEKPQVFRFDAAAAAGVYFNYRNITNHPEPVSRLDAGYRIIERVPVRRGEYSEAFKIVQDNLHAGNTYLINLTFPTEVSIEAGLSDIYENSTAKYRLLFKDEFVQFSPEPFVRIEDGRIYSFPMKGTIDASIPDAEQNILDDEKESWEHNTIVDLIRNDLSMVSEKVRVNRFRYIERIISREKELLQVSSEITGVLSEDWRASLGDIILKLLPAGSISGAPKKKTLEVIREAEHGKRGYYTGISGVFDGNNLDTAVNIRFIEKQEDKYYFRSGGGITSSSSMMSEYRELIDKVNVPSNS